MTAEQIYDPDVEWLDHVQPVGMVVAPGILKELGLPPIPQSKAHSEQAKGLIEPDLAKPALPDPWAFFEQVLGWSAAHVAGAPGGPPIPDELLVSLPEQSTVLSPTWAVAELAAKGGWQLLVRAEAPGVDPDQRGALDGWEATPQQRLERLLRESGVFAGLLLFDRSETVDGEIRYHSSIRVVYAPKGESSGHLTFPIRPLATVAGRPMLGGLKLLLNSDRLFAAADDWRLPALLEKSRDAQASVSTDLAGQVLGALHELLRGLDAAEPDLIRELARNRPDHLYEGLLTVLMRLVFVLYAEDRDLLPSLAGGRAGTVYETSYSVRGLYARLSEDAALNPDTMDERQGGWGRMLALFRMIHSGHHTGFVQARGGKLFDPFEFPFLEGRASEADHFRVLSVSDGCLLRILEGLMTIKQRGQARERLSYRTLDVQQIGSVYETVMGFKADLAAGRMIAIKAGKNNRTPVFVSLEQFTSLKPKERIKHLREEVGRTLSASQAKLVEEAKDADDLAAALDSIVDERASPKKHPAPDGSPILQPTDERRRTGSHYTPRSLTAPIVEHALAPAFERLGADATPEQILDLKVCDPAMGSGAFLVEACRALSAQLVRAWERHKDKKPVIPADEDEELHARRLVAQRCLYGVDRNPRAVDLAKLSLWLATLAREHEFTFLDHALKCGDSLVGLSNEQIAAMHWDLSKAPTFVGKIVSDNLREAELMRGKIQQRAEFASLSELGSELRIVDGKLEVARLIGDGVIAAFFGGDKPNKRLQTLVELQKEVQTHLHRQDWFDRARAFSNSLADGEHPLRPFHWPVEFPEIFSRANPGFDAIVGNPPFAGKNTIIAGNAENYLPWLQTLHEGAHGNADLVAHFFRRAFDLSRQGGVFGLIATNTIGQGDTRASGLAHILKSDGAIARATRRLKWPGEAAVTVSVVHVIKGAPAAPMLDDHRVKRISAYLVEGNLDTSPQPLSRNSGKSFQGSITLGVGFTFDELAFSKGAAEGLDSMRTLVSLNPRSASRIFPFIGGEEINNDPKHLHHRYVIDFADMPMERNPKLTGWGAADNATRTGWLRSGVVPSDYPDPVAADWPELLEIVRARVKPDRIRDKREAYRRYWWRFAERRTGLYSAVAPLNRVIAIAMVSPHVAFSFLPTGVVYTTNVTVIATSELSMFCVLQSRVHELWARSFSSTLEDRIKYSPSDAFRTFPFPKDITTSKLDAPGKAYYDSRSHLMIQRNEGLTKTYNRFHSREETAADTQRLRALHAEMDREVLLAYARGESDPPRRAGWEGLAGRARAEFIEQDADEGKKPKTRFDWPSEFKDEVLARLLALNAERAAEERAQGLSSNAEEDDEEEMVDVDD